MSSIIAAGAALGGKELFKKVVVDLYEFIKTKSSNSLRQWSTERQIETLYRRIAQIRRVKTIWQIDKAVDLMEFYCDSHVIQNQNRCRIEKIADLNTTDNILIEGIAGQGKSILLRYLCAVELALGNYIPVFLELRRVSKQQPLKDRIIAAFDALGLTVDDTLFNLLASSGKVLLLLDAFDEVPDEIKASVLTDIEDLAAKHDRLRIIVTSRPHYNIRVSSHFAVVTLDNLQGDEYVQVIHKLAGGQTWATALVKHIEKDARHIRGLLCTPLMVTLLVLSYKSYQKLPTKLSDFYDALFQTLLQRHDGTKPGFTRQRGCNLDDNQYRLVFETLCILAKKTGKQSFDSNTVYSLSKTAIGQCELKASPSNYIDDIVKITCLILRDGEEHRFIHKTVQEYYTASFIQRKPDVWVTEFYGKLLQKNAYGDWTQELAFLSEIDSYRYNKYYFLPAILAFFDITEANLDLPWRSVSRDLLRQVLHPLYFGISIRSRQREERSKLLERSELFWFTVTPLGFLASDLIHQIIIRSSSRAISDAIRKGILPSETEVTFKKKILHPKRCDKWVSASKILDHDTLAKPMLDAADRYCEHLFCKAKEIRDSLRGEESRSLLDGLV